MTNSGITRANHWKLRKLSSVADVLSGSTPSTKDSTNFDGDIPWITPKDLATLKIHYIGRGERNVSSKGKKSSSLKDVPIGSVVLSTRAPVGLIAIAKAKLTTNQGCKSLVPKNGEVDGSFLYHLLKHNESYLQQFASGTTFEELSLSVLGDMEFNFPPLKIQERIGIVLSAFDNSIANAYSQIDLIDGLLSNKFRYWFEQYKYSESDTNDEELIFNTDLQIRIPKDWEVDQVQKIARVRSGFPFQSSHYKTEGNFQIVTIRNVKENQLNMDSFNVIQELPSKMKSYCKLEKRDLLISLTGNVGRVAMVYKNNLLLNQRVGKIEASALYANYVYLAFLHQQLSFRVHAISNGSSQDNVSPLEIERLPILIPPRNILIRFNEFADPLIQKRLLLSERIDLLRQIQIFLRKGIFTMSIRVKSA